MTPRFIYCVSHEVLMGRFVSLAILLLLVLGTGCVQRTMVITSNPPGALVFMNDQEIAFLRIDN